MNSLTTELVERLFDDVTTSHEAFLRGVRISGNNNNINKNNNNKNNNSNQGGHQASEIGEFSITMQNSSTNVWQFITIFYSDVEPLLKYSPVTLYLSPSMRILNENLE